jgi:hypothetical protein
MKTSLKFLLYLVSVVAIAFSFPSCERDDDDSLPSSSGSSATIKTQVLIYTGDSNGDPVSGVTVRIGSSTSITDNFGNALFKDVQVDKKRFIVKASKAGHFEAVKGVSIQQGNASYHVRFSMLPLPAPATFSASSGGNVNLNNGGTVVFTPGSIATASGTPYTGPVQVYSHYYSPADPNFETTVPGGDLLGIDDDGNNVALVSFGMMNVQLQDPSGNPLNLLPGTTAQLTFPIASSQSAIAPSTIPMWYLDESTSMWIEEGVAVKQGNAYVGTVSHFTYWNCDYPGERANITGTVVDCNGNPVAGAVVTLNGFMNVTTNNAGTYSTWVPSGWSITYQLLSSYNSWTPVNSVAITFTAVANQTNTIPVISVICPPYLSGLSTDCAGNPVSAFITIQQGTSTHQSFQSSSQFNIALPFTGTCNVTFQSQLGTFDTTINVPQGFTGTISLGTVALCDSIQLNGTDYIIIDGGPFNSQLFYLLNSYGDAYPDSINSNTSLWNSGTNASPSSLYNFECTINLIGLGTYVDTYPSVSQFYYVAGDTAYNFDLSIDTPGDNITNWNSVTGIVEVEFHGTVTLFDQMNGSITTATIVMSHFTFSLL